MGQDHNITKVKKWEQVSEKERYKIEGYSNLTKRRLRSIINTGVYK
jgi:hypothetical protein